MQNRVTVQSIESRIEDVRYFQIPDTTLTFCTMVNGFTVTGESACVDPKNFVKGIGEEIAYDNAFNKLWPLEGYLLAEKRSKEWNK